MYRCPLGLTFFGLTPTYRNILFGQIHDLVFHGNGGFNHSEVYNMPTWLRIFHIKKINEFNEKQQDEIDKAKGINWKALSRIKEIKPTVKRYLYKHISSKVVEIEDDER